MRTLLIALTIICSTGFVGSLIGVYIAMYKDERGWVCGLFISAFILSLPTIVCLYMADKYTEGDVVVYHNKHQIKTYYNVHDFDDTDTPFFSFTDRHGKEYNIIEGGSHSVKLENKHEYTGKKNFDIISN